ncbi:hypothetical protein Hanom_Chr06g00548361 [Helianthus anomalus]
MLCQHKGEPVIHLKEVVFDDVLAVIPLFGEYYSNVAKDKHYEKNPDKIIRDVMTTSLRQRDEERIKRNVENLVDELKKVAVEKKVEEEDVKEEEGEKEEQKPEEEAVNEKQQNEDDLKKKEEAEKKLESLVEMDDGAGVGEEQKKNEDVQTQTEEKIEVSTEVKTDSKVLNKIDEQCMKCMETCSDCTKKDEKFRTRNLEFTKIEEVFKNKCKETLENEKILKDNDEKQTQKRNLLEKENEIFKEKVSKMIEECLQKENSFQEMKREYDSIKLAYHITKESYEDVKSKMKLV